MSSDFEAIETLKANPPRYRFDSDVGLYVVELYSISEGFLPFSEWFTKEEAEKDVPSAMWEHERSILQAIRKVLRQ